MKNIINLIILALLLTTVSCKKEFIQRLPVASVTIDNLYKTDKDYQDAVVGTYSALRDAYSNMWQYGDIRGDDAFIFVSNQPNTRAIDVFSINSSEGMLNTTWANYYLIINRANNILTRIENADGSVIKNKDRYIGEAKFLRALVYFCLVRIFGDVQMITNLPTTEETLKIPRNSAAKIYADIIIKDFADAAIKLPIVNTGAEVGRGTKGAALALLGKVYLTVKDFAKAEQVLNEITAAPFSYALLPNFNALFDYSKDEHHSEYIFDIEYESNLNGMGSVYTNQFLPNVVQILTFYGIVGGFGESLSPTTLFVDLWNSADKRKDITVQCCGSWTNPTTGQVIKFNSTTSQSYTKKYITAVPALNDSKANWKVVRYADVLLMLAEALNENGKTTEALVQLNRVHTRAGLLAYTNLTQSELRDAVALERRFELAFEGHRWFDLVRTGKALSSLSAVGMKDYMTVFPVPLREMQVMNNTSIFPQNPGYN